MRRILAFALLAALTVSVSACESTDPVSKYPSLTFSHLPSLMMQAESIEVVSQFKAPFKDPHIEHLMPLPVETALTTWARDRIKTNGTPGASLRFVILDAAVTEEALEVKEGFSGWFSNDQEFKYVARAKVALELRDTSRRVLAETVAEGWKQRTLPEDASLKDKEDVWFEMVESLMQVMNSELDKGVRKYFQSYLR